MTAGGCADARLSLGAYVLGALDPAERARVESHLASCAECREELASFAALPGLLSRVSLHEVQAAPEDPGPQLLDRIIAAVTRERRQGRRLRLVYSAAAAVVVAVAISVAAVAGFSHPSSNGLSGPTVSASAVDPTTHIKATVVEWPRKWGASVRVTLADVPLQGYGYKCQLVAVGAAGEQDVAASWAAPTTGKLDAYGATSLTDVRSFKVVGSDGSTLVTIPVSNA